MTLNDPQPRFQGHFIIWCWVMLHWYVRRSQYFAEQRSSVSRLPPRVLEDFPVRSLMDMYRITLHLRRHRKQTSELKSYHLRLRTLRLIKSRHSETESILHVASDADKTNVYLVRICRTGRVWFCSAKESCKCSSCLCCALFCADVSTHLKTYRSLIKLASYIQRALSVPISAAQRLKILIANNRAIIISNQSRYLGNTIIADVTTMQVARS